MGLLTPVSATIEAPAKGEVSCRFTSGRVFKGRAIPHDGRGLTVEKAQTTTPDWNDAATREGSGKQKGTEGFPIWARTMVVE